MAGCKKSQGRARAPQSPRWTGRRWRCRRRWRCCRSARSSALVHFAGLRARSARLVQAQLERRPPLKDLHGRALALERTVQDGLRQSLHWAQTPDELDDEAPFVLPAALPETGASQPASIAPVWLWLQAVQPPPAEAGAGGASDAGAASGQPQTMQPPDAKRRRARRVRDSSNKSGLILFHHAHSFFSWAEFVHVDRTSDDDEDKNAARVADDLDEIAIARHQLPEWDERRAQLIPNACRAQRLRYVPPAAKEGEEGQEGAGGSEAARTAAEMARRLRATSRQVRRRFEALRAAPRWQRGLPQGEELDLDAWVRWQGERAGSAGQPRSEAPPVWARRQRSERSLACLMLADLSLSTDAYATPQARVIDLVRDSLYVFGNALDAVGDPFEMLGFSSVRRLLRVHEIKRFNQSWDDAARERVAAIKPGFYTRMGAAIRYGTGRLAERPERQRLLLILSDGKPNDLDNYEARHGLEDTRHAVQEARQAALAPFCVTIDQEANAYLPRLFGLDGWALIHRPGQLARALSQLYVRLTAQAR